MEFLELVVDISLSFNLSSLLSLELINEEYGVVYKITNDGIPILVAENARRMTEEEHKAYKNLMQGGSTPPPPSSSAASTSS